MSLADHIFIDMCNDILTNGTSTEGEKVRPHWPDGTPAYTIKKFGVVNRYDLSKEFPILTLRRTAIKSATDEMLWIWQRKSNNIHDLKSHVWDEWADADGSIGKAYGYQMGVKHQYKEGMMDQVDRVIYDLKNNPFSRRIMTNIYVHQDLHEMNLYPCAYSMTFNVTQKKGEDRLTLNAILNQRSQDVLAANNWNVVQYAVLVHMLAQVCDMNVGELVHVIADAHIYDRHVDAIKELISREPFPAPKFWLNPEIKDFYQFTPDDVKLEGYQTGENKVPQNLKYGISAGIGLFITIVGLKGAGVITTDAYYDGKAVQSSTLVKLGDVGSAPVVLALVGILIVATLWHYRVKGSILIGIIATWVLGIIAQLCGWYQGASLIPDFANYSVFGPVQNMATETFFKFDFGYVAQHALNFAVIVFAFLFVDLFDTVGTLIGVAQEGNLLNEKGELPRVGRALMSDALGTCLGACLGTSTVTSYVESTTGVAEGGRTGLTALTSAILFILAIPLYPIFLAIPSFATAPALVFVGLLMIKNVTKMDFDSDIADTVGGFVAIIFMPFAYSIATGIMFGILTWVILKIVTGKIKEIHPIMWVAFALFAVRIVTLICGVSS